MDSSFTHIAVPLNVLNDMVNYLSKCPYNEVSNILKLLEANSKAVSLLEEKIDSLTQTSSPVKLASKKTE